MNTKSNVVEVHLSSGLTLPLRKTQTKQGKTVWAVMDRHPKTGERFFNGFGVLLPLQATKTPHEITTIKAEGFGTIRLHHDVTPPKINPKNGRLTGNQPRATGRKEVVAEDGELYTLTFRATLRSDEEVNVSVEIKRSGIAFKSRVLDVNSL